MCHDLENRLQSFLYLEKELAFLLPGEAERRDIEYRRNEALHTLVADYTCSGSGELPEADAKCLGTALLFLRNIQEEEGWVTPPSPLRVLCQSVKKKKRQDEILEAYCNTALNLWQRVLDALEGKTDIKHKARRFCLERVIKHLRRLAGEGSSKHTQQIIQHELARALFLRARIIRRKGFTAPLKKKEILLEALNTLPDSPQPATPRLRAWIHYELARLEDEQHVCLALTGVGVQALEAAVHQIDLKNCPEDAVLLLTLAEKDATRFGPILQKLQKDIHRSLDKAWAALLLGQKSEAVDLAMMAASQLPVAFSHEAWERMVGLIRSLAANTTGASGWKKVALKTWRVCRKREQRTHNLHLRWYWSRQRELYDLAFQAADKPEEKAQIADSLKSRPALTLAQLQTQVDNDSDLQKFYEEEALGYLNQYIANIHFKPETEEQSDPIPWKSPPDPWIVVHFYLRARRAEEQGQDTGYALIYNSRTQTWHERTFRQIPLWQAFWSWQEAYRLHGDSQGIETCSRFLEALCLALGSEMAFLFDETLFPPDQPVVFVPHDFLHRLPLHVAISEEAQSRRVWTLPDSGKAPRQSSFLPAWWLYDAPASAARNVKKDTSRALIKWNESIVSDIEDLGIKPVFPASAEDLLDMPSIPSLLILYCHGHAHPANPFQSSLELVGNPTLLDILQRLDCRGMRIFLAACETDLVPPLSSALDEHLSISFAFLQKGAAEILGTLWEVSENYTYGILEDLTSSSAAFSTGICLWSQSYLKDYMADPVRNLKNLFYAAPFRTLGLYTGDSDE